MAEGRCLCGDVAYDAGGEANWSSHCHCRSCRRHAGSAVATFVSFKASEFRLTKGQLSDYASSPGVTRSFCGRCGTPVAFRAAAFPGEIHLYLGTLDRPEDYPATVQVHCAERLPWLSVDEHLAKFATVPPG